MSAKSPNVEYPGSWQKPPFIQNSLVRWCIIIGSVIYLSAALGTMDINVERMMEGLPRGKRFLEAFFPPNFADNRGVVWEGIAESWIDMIDFLDNNQEFVREKYNDLETVENYVNKRYEKTMDEFLKKLANECEL